MAILDLSEIRKLAEEEDFGGEFADLPLQSDPDKYTTSHLLFIRLCMVVGCFFTTFWLFCSLLLALPMLAVSFLSGGRLTRRWLHRVWRGTRLSAACLTACFVGMFSAQFGVTILCVYLLIHADESEGAVVTLLRSQIQEAFHRF